MRDCGAKENAGRSAEPRLCVVAVCIAALAAAGRRLNLLVLVLIPLSSALAQQPPDAGTLLRETQPKAAPKTPAAPPPAPPLARPENPAAIQVMVKAFRFTGVTLIPESELQRILAPFVDKSASFDDLQHTADVVANAYRARHLLAHAYLPEQDLKDGVVTIAVIEGHLGDLRIEHTPEAVRHRLSDGAIRRFILSHQDAEGPIHVDALERSVALLNDLPGSSVTSVLEPGESEGKSRLVVKATDEPLLSGYLQADNYSATNVGEARGVGSLSLDSPAGLGDQATAFITASSGLDYGRLSYDVPIGGDGVKTGLSLAALDYRYNFANSEFRGNAYIGALTVAYPLLRTRQVNLNIGLAQNFQKFRNTDQTSGVRVELNDKRIRDTMLTASGDSLDGLGGGGFNQFSLGITVGHLDLSGNPADLAADQAAAGPMRNGTFVKVTMSAMRLQRIATRDSALISASLQVSGANLDSAEKLGISGPTSVRAYGQNEGNGDEGYVLTLEWHHDLPHSLQSIVFADTGKIRRDHTVSAATASPNIYRLSGAGIGASWGDARSLQIRASAAWRLVSDPIRDPLTGEDSDGTKRVPRIWATVAHAF